jgi:urease accessory protein
VTPTAARVGRDGRLTLRFERRGPRTVIARCGYTLPLQVLVPLALDDPATVVSVLNPTGGLVGGDTLTLDVEVAPGAHACLTTPSATKVYRATSCPARQDVTLRVAAGARLEWVPDHTIPFAGAAFRQTLTAHVAEGAALVLVDAFAAGRVARGETWEFVLLDSALGIDDARGRLLHDRFRLRAGTLQGLGVTEGRPYFATVVVVADAGVERFAARVREAAAAGAAVGVGLLPRRGAVVRCLASDAPALASAISRVWNAARGEVLALPPVDLRKS